MAVSMAPLLISLRPCYSGPLFEGVKKVELRRQSLTHVEGRDVFIYVTGPVMELQGGFRVGKVWTGTPDEVWETVADSAGVSQRDFDIYYAGQSIACALEIKEVWQYENPISLRMLRHRFQRFVVPQSWRYVKPEEHQSFRNMRGHRIPKTTNEGLPDQLHTLLTGSASCPACHPPASAGPPAAALDAHRAAASPRR